MSDYEYQGLMAEFWDLLRGDTSQWADRFFFLDLIHQHGQPVLDVGCGTGRLLLDYLAQGIDIDGVDNSPEMLAICQRKARKLGLQPMLHQQYMEALALPRLYRTIIVPSSSLQLVIEPDHVRLAMARLTEHLAPGGVLAASFMTLWSADQPLESTWVKEAIRPEDDAVIRRVSWSRYDPASECEETRDTYQVLYDDQLMAEEQFERAPATRSYSQAQAKAVFETAGLGDVHIYHEFTFDPVQPEDTLFTLVGTKPA